MASYVCKLCDYETGRSNDFQRHNKSKKHLQIKKTTITVVEKKDAVKEYICDVCKKTLSCRQSLSRHKNHFCSGIKKKDSPKTSESDEIQKLKKQMEEVLKCNSTNINNNLIEKALDIAMLNAKSNNKSLNMMSYAVKHFNSAPPIKLLEGTELAGLITYESKHTIEELLVHHYETKTLSKFLGDMIIRVYKKKNPKKQSMWATDISRLSFIVRQIVGDVGTNEWVSDKNGIKIKEFIVMPFLEKIKEIMIENVNSYVNKVKNNDYKDSDIKKIMENMYLSKKVVYIITKEYLHSDILRYIAPSFGFDTKTIVNDMTNDESSSDSSFAEFDADNFDNISNKSNDD